LKSLLTNRRCGASRFCVTAVNATEPAEEGHTVIVKGKPTGKPYSHEAVHRMLKENYAVGQKLLGKRNSVIVKASAVVLE
jgi:hypothetical protein